MISGTATLFMFTDDFKRIHELLMFDEGGHRSWFIDSTVLAGNSLLYIGTLL